jgi:uncharacterized protein (DUF2126 family)
MALPVSRTKTLVEGDIIESALVDDIQDAIVALYEGARKADKYDVSYSAFRSTGGGAPVIDADGVLVLASGESVEVEMPLPQSASVQWVRAWMRGVSSSAELTITILVRRNDLQATNGIGTGGDNEIWEWVTATPTSAPLKRSNDEDVFVLELANTSPSLSIKISKLQVFY